MSCANDFSDEISYILTVMKLFSTKPHSPTFTSDWFSGNLSVWDTYIKPHLLTLSEPKILEIGAFEGRSSLYFLSNFPKLKLTVIDPWRSTDGASEDTFYRYQKNVKKFKKRVKIFRNFSFEILGKFNNSSFDCIYIDGDHKSIAVIHDAVLSYNLIKNDGLIIFDDYLGGDRSEQFPKPAIDFFHKLYADSGSVSLIYDGYQRIYKKHSVKNAN